MKVLLVNPALQGAGHPARRDGPPLGLAYLAARLRERGHAARIHEGNLDTPDRFDPAADMAWRPDLVGLTATTPGFAEACRLAREARAALPEAWILLGGHHATALGAALLPAHPEFDAAVLGEGEETLADLADRYPDRDALANVPGVRRLLPNGTVAGGAPRRWREELDSLPLPARDLLPPLSAYPRFLDPVDGREKRVATVLSSRGCPHSCRFCAVHGFADGLGRRWRPRSAAAVAEEIALLVQEYRAEHIAFVDDNFFVLPDRSAEIFRRLERMRLSVSFSFATRADQVARGEEHIGRLAAAGCRRIELGVESGSQSVLERYGKGITVEENSRAIALLRRNGIFVRADLILFDPWTTLEELAETAAFLETNGLAGQHPPAVYNALALLPGTALHERRGASALEGPAAWEFADPRAAAVHAGMQAIRRDCQERIDRLILAFEAAAAAASPERRARCHLHAVALKRLPFRALQNIVAAGLGGRGARAACAEFLARIPTRLDLADRELEALPPAAPGRMGQGEADGGKK